MESRWVVGVVGALALALAVPAAPAAGAVPGAAEARGSEIAARRAAAAGVEWGPCPEGSGLSKPIVCGTVTVPVDYADPDGETIKLHLSRLPATGPTTERQGALLYNPGGPGGNGMSFPLYPARPGTELWQRLNRAYDLVGFAPRGVGPSAPVSCQDPEEFQRGPSPAPRQPSEAFKRRMNTEAAAYAKGCQADQGTRLAHFTTPNNARDLHTIRAALGEERLNYLGVSYGTYLGSVYATLFPEAVRRMALDSVVNPDPDLIWYESNLRQSLAFESRWSDWKRWVAEHHDVYGLGQAARDVQEKFDAALDAVAREPLRGGVGPKEVHSAFLSVTYTDKLWASMATALAEHSAGRHRHLAVAARPDPNEATEEENGNAVYTAVECSDAPWPTDWERWDRDHTELARVAPFETWDNAWMNLPCAHWPGPRAAPVDVAAPPGALPPVLLLAASQDAATPYEGAVETQRRLPGSVLVTERGAGQHGVAGGNACMDEHLETYLLTGRTPPPEAECAARAEPEPTYTRAAAKRTDITSPPLHGRYHG